MRQITVVVHRENGSWWAESDEVPGFSALGSTLDELRSEMVAGLGFHLDDVPFRLIERDESGAAMNAASVFAPSQTQWWTRVEGSQRPMAEWFSRMGVAHMSRVAEPV